jgi:hypothetical protein
MTRFRATAQSFRFLTSGFLLTLTNHPCDHLHAKLHKPTICYTGHQSLERSCFMKQKLLIQTFLSFALLACLILPVAYGETDWVEWTGNPIISRSSDVYYPSVLFDPDRFSGHGHAAVYKMWADKELQYFRSKDGINWRFVKETGKKLAGPVRHPLVEYYSDGFDGVNSGNNPSDDLMFYRLWYWNASFLTDISAIHYAESPNGIRWYNNRPIAQGVPLLVTGEAGNINDWNWGSYGPADVLYNPDALNSDTDWVFTMYYDGTNKGDESLGIAFSKDGIHWIGHDADSDGNADPVLEGGEIEDWDGGIAGYVSRATVLKIDGQYRMWYSGGMTDMNDGIGYAESPDGLVWSKYPTNPIFHVEDGVAWREARTYTPMVIYDPDAFCGHGQAYRYKMWFSGETSDEVARTGYAVGGDPSLDCFDIRHTIILRPKRKRNDQIFVLRATFWAEIPDEKDRVVFALNGQDLVNVEFFEFTNNRNGYVYRTSKREKPSIKMTLNFDKGTWELTVKDVDLPDELGQKIEYSLEVGDFIGCLELKMRKKKNGWYYLEKNEN